MENTFNLSFNETFREEGFTEDAMENMIEGI
jgi:hypothetical protein